MSFTKMKSLHMFRFRVRKNTGLLLKFTQTAVLFQDTSIFFSLEIELSLSSGSYFFFRKLLFHFTFQHIWLKFYCFLWSLSHPNTRQQALRIQFTESLFLPQSMAHGLLKLASGYYFAFILSVYIRIISPAALICLSSQSLSKNAISSHTRAYSSLPE